MIALYLQVLAVIAFVAVAAAALGNETRLLIDERHEERDHARQGRHRAVTGMIEHGVTAALLRVGRRLDTAALFAEADEAFNASAPTVYVSRVIA